MPSWGSLRCCLVSGDVGWVVKRAVGQARSQVFIVSCMDSRERPVPLLLEEIQTLQWVVEVLGLERPDGRSSRSLKHLFGRRQTWDLQCQSKQILRSNDPNIIQSDMKFNTQQNGSE